jgi:hypothetical protein
LVRNKKTCLADLIPEHVIQMFFKNDLAFWFQAILKDFCGWGKIGHNNLSSDFQREDLSSLYHKNCRYVFGFPT